MWCSRPLWLALALALGACDKPPIEVAPPDDNDYNRGELAAAVDRFVAAGRTPAAYGELARTIFALRPGMDRSTAELAERSLVVLALIPVKSVAAQPIAVQADALALAVWPALLADEIEEDDILRRREPRADQVLPRPGETARAYLERICGKPLAADCKQVVPERQAEVVSALAIRRATERVRIAVADCLTCAAEPGWTEAVRGWEQLDHVAAASISAVLRDADPANWPTAGAASLPDPGLPVARLASSGELVIDGERHGGPTRVAALRELRARRGAGAPIAFHLSPELSLAAVRGLLADARKAGAREVAVIARGARYPWERRIYWISDTTGVRVDLRPTDTLQLLLHAVDHLGSPGAVARVE